ncbi:MAG: hypothetical protein KDA55_20945 [Planctomycetales bacterium]|nr:hypothetical protein [Planctomycetales bacterium]
MKHATTWLIVVIVGTVGCQRSAPQLDTLNPFGAMRVPPPSTGGYGQPNSYYQYQSPTLPTGTPSFEVGKKPGTSLGASTTGSGANGSAADNATTLGWSDPARSSAVSANIATTADVLPTNAMASAVAAQPVNLVNAGTHGTVVPVAHHAPIASSMPPATHVGAPANLPIAVQVVPPSGASMASRSGGMSVTDLSRRAEPASFQPPPDLIEISQLPPAAAATAPARESANAPITYRFPETDAPIGSGVSNSLKWRSPE